MIDRCAGEWSKKTTTTKQSIENYNKYYKSMEFTNQNHLVYDRI